MPEAPSARLRLRTPQLSARRTRLAVDPLLRQSALTRSWADIGQGSGHPIASEDAGADVADGQRDRPLQAAEGLAAGHRFRPSDQQPHKGELPRTGRPGLDRAPADAIHAHTELIEKHQLARLLLPERLHHAAPPQGRLPTAVVSGSDQLAGPQRREQQGHTKNPAASPRG